MTINIFIDNNVWDFLYERQIDLAIELPDTEFSLYITREAEFEILAIPPEKAALKQFIDVAIKRYNIKTDRIFGFYDDKFPENEQRIGGFDEGRWVSKSELDFIQQQTISQKLNLKTRLYSNEADLSLAARSFDSIVISFDHDKGPLRAASKLGGKIVFLTDFNYSKMSLNRFIKTSLPTFFNMNAINNKMYAPSDCD